ncbi:MAG TPA: type III-B CRISPR module-associated Cmr3 family protein [Myxococcota bacterium]|nr:type III-B CRISPR module-associated Cmr3 family protein [Myxococcota bacterium]HQK51570.1 type III-B CRISPR module-associated Cmr3 family protein [Myxococcota bacterium]
MADFLIVPLQALQFGDGRASGSGGMTRTLSIPWPQTLRGAIRTALAHRMKRLSELIDGGAQPIDPRIGGRDDLGTLDIRGPLPSALWEGTQQVWVPRPLDFEVFGPTDPDRAISVEPLKPVLLEPGDGLWDLQGGRPRLVPWSLASPPQAKPMARPPAWIPFPALVRWAIGDFEGLRATIAQLDGIEISQTSTQVHVVLTPGRTAEKGGLFVTEQIELNDGLQGAWWMATESLEAGEAPLPLTLGGQQGLARLIAAPGGFPGAAPGALPDEVHQAIEGSGGYLRVLVLTPALFSHGSMPGPEDLLGGEVRAAAVPGPMPVSGSRLLEKGRAEPRPARRAVPAGSVFVVRYPDPQKALEAAHRMWFCKVGSRPEDRLQGYGLVAVGGLPKDTASQMDQAWDIIQGIQ